MPERPPLLCPQCLEYFNELERIKAIGARKGFYDALTPGANPRHDVDQELALWLSVHPRATVAEAWRGGWSRAWQIARERIKDAEQRTRRYVTEVASLRSRIGVLLTELSRWSDGGGR